MKALYNLLFFCFSISTLFAQNANERYSTVGITYEDYLTLVSDETHGLAIDHFHKNENALLEFVFSESELTLLDDRNIDYEMIIEDAKNHFLEINAGQESLRVVGCGLTNFDDGDMGGYHTYDQMVENINNMQTQFPDVVEVTEIGQSLEGRPIFAVKISDNVSTDESDEEGVVYFEAITHAREPMSLEATLYYMWWLLENYETDDEVAYLVDHREIYFVPIVNPDGYVYNQQTDPNGGGFWRKNRRPAGGCFGVDLNRNYPKGWGLNTGSSNDPCTQTYRGEAPFSEPESAAIADFVATINPAIAFSNHTYGDKFLSPWGYVDSLASYETYAEFVSEFIPPTYDGYGTTAKMLNYTSSGTTRDYMHSQGIFAWTPEIGHSFWESSAVICDRVQEFLVPMKYLTWVSGDYACFHDFTLAHNNVWTGDTIAMDVRVKNRGLTKVAQDVSVSISSSHPSIEVVNNSDNYGNIDFRSFGESTNFPFRFEVTGDLTPGERIPFTVEVYQDNALSYTREIFVNAGAQTVLMKTDFESDNPWLTPALNWDTSFMDAVSGFHSFADSRYGNYLANSNSLVAIEEPVDLTNVTNPIVTFNAKWALEPDFDEVTFLVSSNGISGWDVVSGLYTDPFGNYTANQHWVQEQIDLSSYIGQSELYFAFRLNADNGIHSDGIYIDDFMVSDYTEPIMIGNNNVTTKLEKYRIMPNPNQGDCLLEVEVEASVSAEILLYDLSGKVLLQKEVILDAGQNQIAMNDIGLKAGVYTIQLRTEVGQRSLKMVVLP